MCDCHVYKLLKILDEEQNLNLKNGKSVRVETKELLEGKCPESLYLISEDDVHSCGLLGVILKYNRVGDPGVLMIKVMKLEAILVPGSWGYLLGYTGFKAVA